MSASACILKFYKLPLTKLGQSVTDLELKSINTLVTTWERILKEQGIDPLRMIPDGTINKFADAASKATTAKGFTTALEQLIDLQVNHESKLTMRTLWKRYESTMARVEMMDKINTLATEFSGDTDASKATAKINALRELVSTSVGREKRDMSLEELVQATLGFHFNEGFLTRITKEVPDVNLAKALHDEKFAADMIREAYHLYRRKEGTATDNEQAHKVGRILLDELDYLRDTNNRVGDNMIPKRTLPSPDHNWNVIKKAGRDEYVKGLADKLDPTVHGDADRRTQVATQIYDKLEKTLGMADRDTLGDTANVEDFGPGRLVPEDSQAVLVFKDGQSWLDYNKQFGQSDFTDMVIGQFQYMSRRQALMKTFGPNWQATWNRLVEYVAAGPAGEGPLADIRSSWDMSQVQSEFARIATPGGGGNAFNSTLQVARNVEVASKLGSAVFASFTDIPIAMTMASRVLGVPGVSRFFDFMSGFTNADRREYARLVNTATEGLLGSLSSRFTPGGEPLTNRWARGTSDIANFIMKASGLEIWTDSEKAGVTELLRLHLGDVLRDRTEWGKLEPKFKNTFERVGFDETKWNELVTRQPLDENGKFDVFSLRATDVADPTGTTMTHRLNAWLRDGVETMIITPGVRDVTNVAGFGFAKPGSPAEAAIKTMLGFQSFSATMLRRSIGRIVHQDSSVADKMLTLSTAAVAMSAVNYVRLQANEAMKGNQLYDPAKPDGWIQAVGTSGILGPLSDTYFQVGGENSWRLLLGEKPSQTDLARMVLGPFFSDLTSGVIHGSAAAFSGTRAGLEGLGLVDPGENDSGQVARREVSKLTNTLSGLVPGENLWYARLLYRAAIQDSLHEMLDPDGYAAARSRAESRAQNSRIDGDLRSHIGQGVDSMFGR